MACALRGERDELLHLMTPELRAAAQRDEIFAWWAADCFALVNEADGAIDFIERAIEFGFINGADEILLVPDAGDTLQFVENIAAVVEADLPDNRRPPGEGELLDG